jgi:sensor histidine kinase YesM
MAGNDQVLKIWVQIMVSDGILQVDVFDNGNGIPWQQCSEINEKLKRVFKNSSFQSDENDHIGLHNVSKRLALIYPEKSSLRVFSREGHGTLVRILIHDINPRGH